MKSKNVLLSIPLFAGLFLGIMSLLISTSSNLEAGLVRVCCDSGTRVLLCYYPRDTSIWLNQNDVNGDGKVEFGLQHQENIPRVYICKTSDGRRIWYSLRLNVDSVTLASLEPFDLPTFATVNNDGPIVAVYALAGFLDDNYPFQLGDEFEVHDGNIDATKNVIFKDGESLPDDVTLDDDIIEALPNYNGKIMVMPNDIFEPAKVEVTDCVYSSEPGTCFSKSIWTFNGDPIGCTFPDGVKPDAGDTVYDTAVLPIEPNDWHWYVEFEWNGQKRRLDFWLDFPQGSRVEVEIICDDSPNNSEYMIEANADDDVYTITDADGVVIHEGIWSKYPDDIPLNFEVVDMRRIFAPDGSLPVDVRDNGVAARDGFMLQPAHPNPFTRTTDIRYTLPEHATVQLDIYSLTGQKVQSLVNTQQEAGTYTVTWNGVKETGGAAPSATYIVRLQAVDSRTAREYLLTSKVVLLR